MRVELRKLSRKSIIGFGYYRDLTVQNVIDKGSGHKLANMYYTLGKIDFLPDVLEELKIVADLKIEKPGKNTKKYDEWKKAWFSSFSDEENIIRYAINKKQSKRIKAAKIKSAKYKRIRKFESTAYHKKYGENRH